MPFDGAYTCVPSSRRRSLERRDMMKRGLRLHAWRTWQSLPHTPPQADVRLSASAWLLRNVCSIPSLQRAERVTSSPQTLASSLPSQPKPLWGPSSFPALPTLDL